MKRAVREGFLLAAGAIFLCGGSLALAGCEGKPSCKLLYKRRKECATGKLPKKNVFLNRCSASRDTYLVKQRIKCSAKSDCSAFKSCWSKAKGQAALRSLTENWAAVMKKHKERGDFAAVLSFCHVHKKRLPSDIKAECDKMPGKAYGVILAKAKKNLATENVSEKHFSCLTLKFRASRVGKQAEAERICKVFETARELEGAIQLAKKYAKQGETSLPLNYCDVKNVAKTQSASHPLIKKLHAARVKACYLDLGRRILRKQLAKWNYCSPAIRTLIDAVAKLKLTDGKLKKLAAAAEKKCAEDQPGKDGKPKK